MLNTVGRFIYTKYRGILYVKHCGKIYLHKILRNTVCWALWEDYLHKILGITLCWALWEDLFTQNTVCWALWEDLFTQNTGDYFLLNTVGIFIYTKYWGLLYVRRFIYTTYWGILYVKHCGKIYVHTILRNSVCWALWEELFTQNTGDYFMLNTVGRLFTQNIW